MAIGATAEDALLVLVTAQIETGVQLRQVAYLRKRHPVVAAEVPAFALDPLFSLSRAVLQNSL